MNNAAERYRTVQGKDVPIDHFLYACFEAERLHEANSPKESRTPCWPELKPYLGQEQTPEDFEDQEIHHLVEDLLSWYRANFPELADQNAWDFSVISEISHTLAALGLDLGEVYRLKMGQPLPRFDEPEARNVWGKIENLVQGLFGSRSNHIFRYFEWSFGEEKKMEPEVGSRPPVGRFSPFFRRQSGPARPPQRANSHDDRPRKPNATKGRGPQDGQQRNSRPDKKRKDGFRTKNSSDRSEADEVIKTKVLKECDEAIEFLTHHAEEPQVTLRPQNSFYRRLQHQYVVDAGFDSQSQGVGHDRSVVVARKS